MSLIPKQETIKLETVKFQMSGKLLTEIKAYCKWIQSDNDLGYFFRKSAEHVLNKDKEWKTYKDKEKHIA